LGDAARDRILYFSGADPAAGNAVWERSLDSLELRQIYESDPPTWHRFCHGDVPTLANAMAVVPNGLFLAVNDAAFRLDLATPYCD
jgi:hypothetical protein